MTTNNHEVIFAIVDAGYAEDEFMAQDPGYEL